MLWTSKRTHPIPINLIGCSTLRRGNCVHIRFLFLEIAILLRILGFKACLSKATALIGYFRGKNSWSRIIKFQYGFRCSSMPILQLLSFHRRRPWPWRYYTRINIRWKLDFFVNTHILLKFCHHLEINDISSIKIHKNNYHERRDWHWHCLKIKSYIFWTYRFRFLSFFLQSIDFKIGGRVEFTQGRTWSERYILIHID